MMPNLVEHRFLLGQKIAEELNSTVAYGPFTGLVLDHESQWSGADQGSMLLGMYEREVLDALRDLSADCDHLIDVGAADGYYAVGALVSGLFDIVVCFEIDQLGQQVIAKNAAANGVSDRVSILGEARRDFVQQALAETEVDLSRTVVLMDIEGGEYSLLNDEVIQVLRQSRIIVELHHFDDADESAERLLRQRLEDTFKVTYVRQGSRDPNQIPLLRNWSDDDRWLMCSESRSEVMEWAICEPLAD